MRDIESCFNVHDGLVHGHDGHLPETQERPTPVRRAPFLRVATGDDHGVAVVDDVVFGDGRS
jgi:hypothetical protein